MTPCRRSKNFAIDHPWALPEAMNMQRAITTAFLCLSVATSGCYFVPPTHPAPRKDGAVVLDDDAGEFTEPVEGLDGGVGPDGGLEPPMDGGVNNVDATTSFDSATSDSGPAPLVDAALCNCTDPQKLSCVASSRTCVQCQEDSECGAGKHCQPSSNTCVECLGETDCTGGKHCLVAAGQCVACTGPEHCAGKATASYCDPGTHMCTNCRAGMDTDCANVPGLNVCQAGTCVQCAGAKRDACATEDKPACSATTFTCDTCKADSDCTRFNKVCDEASARCVACTIDSEAARCGTRSCNPATFSCTQTNRGSLDVCLSCVADSECKSDQRCIALNFGSEPQGGFCMRRQSAACAEPYGIPITRTSLSKAASATYCGFSEQRTSCDAIRALQTNQQCSGGASDCDAAGAVCGTVGTLVQRCTYACTGSAECPTFAPCPTTGMNPYCGKSM
jgi:hypothetical protein